MSETFSSQGPRIPRRQALKLGGAAAAAAVTGVAMAPGVSMAKALPPGPATQPFLEALPACTVKDPVAALDPPPGEGRGAGECGRGTHQRWGNWEDEKFYKLEVKEAWHSFHPHLPKSKIWGYDGIVPGPTFVARYGEPIVVRIYNMLPPNSVGFGSPEISTHLHNLHTPSESDGFTGDYFSPTVAGPTLDTTGPTLGKGSYHDHRYLNCYAGYDTHDATNGDPNEALGTLWYHDHRERYTAPNVYKGLVGMYLLFDEVDSGNENDTNSKALRLPSGVGKYDIPLVIADKQFDSSGYLFFDQFENDGILGNKYCVNGKIQPFFKVERRRYRFRILDAGVARLLELYLTHNGVNQDFNYIANDGNLLPAPLIMNKVAIAPAERADIVIDFALKKDGIDVYPTGSTLYLVNRLKQTDGRGPDGPLVNVRDVKGNLVAPGVQVLRFDVGDLPAMIDNSQVPAKLRELPKYSLSEVKRTRTFEFDRENEVWTVNGKAFEVDTVTASPKRGTAEIWVLKGKGSWHHPVHIHFEEGRILSRNGKPPPPHEMGRKDVYVLKPGEEVRIFMRFRDFTGKYLMHCHNLTHEDHEMMIRFDIVD